MTLTPEQRQHLANVQQAAWEIGQSVAAILEAEQAPPTPTTPWIDRVAEMPIDAHPDHPDIVAAKLSFWRSRQLSQITGITIHHTMSDSPLATAQYCTRSVKSGGKGYPSTQYQFWVSQGDNCPVYLLAPLDWAIWHDHTGGHPTTISIGMAGDLSKIAPPTDQIEATARLVVWLMQVYKIPLAEVRGHNERAIERGYKTDCPGWKIRSWRLAFFTALGAVTRPV